MNVVFPLCVKMVDYTSSVAILVITCYEPGVRHSIKISRNGEGATPFD